MDIGQFSLIGASIPESKVEAFRASWQFDEQLHLAEYPVMAR
jgi:hypothetical protein